jgi:hypothetical protein
MGRATLMTARDARRREKVLRPSTIWQRLWDRRVRSRLVCRGNSEVQKSGFVATGISKSKRPKFRLFSAQTVSRNGSGPR